VFWDFRRLVGGSRLDSVQTVDDRGWEHETDSEFRAQTILAEKKLLILNNLALNPGCPSSQRPPRVVVFWDFSGKTVLTFNLAWMPLFTGTAGGSWCSGTAVSWQGRGSRSGSTED